MGRGTRSAEVHRRLGALKEKVAAVQGQIDEVREHIRRLGTATRGERRAVVDRLRCTGCGMCEQVCPVGAVRVTYLAHVDAERCTGCGICVQNCPQGAIRLRGERQSSSKQVREPRSA